MERTATGCLLYAVNSSANFTAIDWMHIILIIALIISIILVVKFNRNWNKELKKNHAINQKCDEEKKSRIALEKEEVSWQSKYDKFTQEQSEEKEEWIRSQQAKIR